ncbi:MAG: hypothetical protein ACOCUL_04880, partial [Bacteroidota bacterium]
YADCKKIIPNFRAFEIKVDIPWNWLAARNIGAYHAKSPWIILTDIDHVILNQHYRLLLDKKLDEKNIYLFDRRDCDRPVSEEKGSFKLRYKKPHDDSFLMTKEMFWKGGGYDEEFSGHYGTSGRYRSRMQAVCNKMIRLKDIYLIRYDRKVIADASTTTLKRKEGRDPKALKRIEEKKKAEGRKNDIKTLTFPYREII